MEGVGKCLVNREVLAGAVPWEINPALVLVVLTGEPLAWLMEERVTQVPALEDYRRRRRPPETN